MQSFAHFTPTPQKIVAQKPKTISSKEEFEVIKTHRMQGANMLRRLENFEDEPLLQTAYDIARWHHERWDGRGYPDGLKGNDIPISAQLSEFSRGSPPRMRGKEYDLSVASLGVRITPACAGKRICAYRFDLYGRDHLRVCGEKDKAAEKAQHLRGSPPRMRGKELLAADDLQTLRITPACAGKRCVGVTPAYD